MDLGFSLWDEFRVILGPFGMDLGFSPLGWVWGYPLGPLWDGFGVFPGSFGMDLGLSSWPLWDEIELFPLGPLGMDLE